jgi:hypothetical protein
VLSGADSAGRLTTKELIQLIEQSGAAEPV